MDRHNYQPAADVEYKPLDRGNAVWAVKPGPGAIAPIPAVPGSVVVSENFEGTPWLAIPFVSGDWTVATDQSHSPTHSYRSKVIGNNASTQFTIQNASGSPQLSFWLRTNTEQGFDLFTVQVDGTTVYTGSGFNDLHRVALNIGFGFQIDFIYSKDFSSSPVGDGCWVDDVVFGSLDIPAVPWSPAHPLVYAPLHTTAAGIRLKTDVAFAAPQHVIVDSIPEVEIKNDSGNPVPVSGTVSATQGTSPWVVGTHAVTQGTSPWVSRLDAPTLAALEAITVQNPAGAAAVNIQDGGNSITVDGTVNIGTIPEVEIKNDTGNPVPVSGTVTALQG